MPQFQLNAIDYLIHLGVFISRSEAIRSMIHTQLHSMIGPNMLQSLLDSLEVKAISRQMEDTK